MFRSNYIFKNPSLVGLVSPFLCSQQPQVLQEVLDKAKTPKNVDLMMQAVMREHLIRDNAPIFRETENLVSASKETDPKSYSAYLLRFVNENRTDLPLFDVFLKKADQTQINQALMAAMKNGDTNSVKRILPHVKDKQTTLDQMFMNLRNATKLSHEIIQELLPLCSDRVKSRYLNEMIIQKDRNAVRIIIEFFKPTIEHRNLAKIHFSNASMDILKRTSETQRGRFLKMSGMVNVCFVGSVIEDVKDTGKQMVLSARETAKLVLRRMGLIAGPSDLIMFDTETNLENLSGLVPHQDDEEDSSEQFAFPMAFGQKTSVLTSKKDKYLLSFAQVGMLSEKARLAITGSRVIVEDLDEESDDKFFVVPRVYQNNQDEQSDRFGRIAAATVAGLAAGVLMVERQEEVEPSPQGVQEQAKKETPIVPQKQEDKVVAEKAPVVQASVAEEKSPKIARYNAIAQMKADLEAGHWRL